MRVLVVRNDKIGDLVLALPLIAALKRAGCFVGVWASDYARPLLEEDKRVDSLDEDAGYDAALLLWANWVNAWRIFRLGIARRIGAGARPFSFLFNARVALRRSQGLKHESEYNLDLAAPLNLKLEAQAPRLNLGKAALAQAGAELKRLKLKRPLMLHPGSRGSAQNWEGARYAVLGRALKKKFKGGLLVCAGPGEEKEASALAKACGAKLHRPLPLAAFAALCGQASLFVSASTGPMHLAAAGGAPTLSLFPPIRAMSPLRWGPRGNRHAVLTPRGLGLNAPVTGENYVNRISVEEAVEAACSLL